MPPPDLLTLQRLMASAVMRPLDAGDRADRTWIDGSSAERIADEWIKPNDRLSAFERLQIYNRQYWFRLLDCLYEDFPGLRAVLGNRRFLQVIRSYLEATPSESFLLRNLGNQLPGYLRANRKLTEPYSAVAAEMASLEWAQAEAFDAASRPAVTARRLAGKSPEAIFLQLQPHLTLLDLRFAVDEWAIRILREEDQLRAGASNAVADSPPLSSRRAIGGRIPRQRKWLAVHRVDNEVFFKPINRKQFEILTAIQSGESLGAACLAAGKVRPERLREWFQSWTTLGWFWMK